MAQQLNQVPPNLEVWEVQGTLFLVRLNDELDPPIPLVWRVRDSEEKAALGIRRVDRRFATWDQFYATGPVENGSTRELLNTTEDPWEAMKSIYETESRVKPWLLEPEILALWESAALEGRPMSPAELQGTQWWRTHSDTERAWISLNASDPTTANGLIRDNRTQVERLLREQGVDRPPANLVSVIADNWTSGKWTELTALNQIQGLADPFSGIFVLPELRSFVGKVDTTRAREEDVRSMVNLWLGPAYSSGWDEKAIQRWAGAFRNDPDAQTQLVEALRNQRMALFPEYDNPNLTYEDIAAPWRGVFQQMWGQIPDETDPLFAKIVKLNDLATAEKLLRREGRARGNPTVVKDLLKDLGAAFGGGVRRSDPAVL